MATDMHAEENLVALTKAIRDEVRAMLKSHGDELLVRATNAALKSLEAKVLDRVAQAEALAQAVGDAGGARLKAAQLSYEKKLAEAEVKSLAREKSLEERYRKALAEQEGRLRVKAAEIEARYAKMLEQAGRSHADGVEQIKSLLKSLPTPQVTVQPAQVNLPEMAPVINVSPSQATQEIKVLVPEQKTPEVKVELMPARPRRKSIRYDEYSRPVEVKEYDEPDPSGLQTVPEV